MTPSLARAVHLHRANQLDAAWKIYESILGDTPDDADAWHLSGLIAAERGNSGEAIRRTQRAVDLQPACAPFQFRLASLLFASGESAAAEPCCRRTLALDPANTDAHVLLARLCMAAGRNEEAAAAFERSLVLQPDRLEAVVELSRLLGRLRRWAPAIALAQRAVHLAGGRREAMLELAALQLSAGESAASLSTLEGILSRHPDDADVVAATGQVLTRQQKFDAAVQRYQQALTLQADCRLAIDGLLAAHSRFGDIPAAMAIADAKCQRWPDDLAARSQRLFLSNYLDQLPADALFEEHRRCGERMEATLPRPPAPRVRPGEGQRRWRIGYVSADFKQHSVAHFIEPVLAGHRRSQFEVFCYSNTFGPDDTSARLARLVDSWRDVVALDDDQLTARIRDDGIDILVDLGGHTADNRLGVFARRAAPIQISWLGYPNTTGLRTMDYRISDAIADPPGDADRQCTERLLRLADGFLCYRPGVAGPTGNIMPPSQAGQPFTFGSFNHIAKLNPTLIALWARLLDALPEARLMLKAAGLGAGSVAARWRAAFAGAGIAPERLILRAATPDPLAHFAAYREIDVALDTFPYNGTTTTCDALWMGVPVLTLRGDRHAARVGASLLGNIGHPELIADSADDFVARGVGLARHPEDLARLHRQVAQSLRTSPLMNEPAFVAKLEDAYRQVWQQHGA